MNTLLIIIPVTAAAFVATNMDNLVLLVALLSRQARQSAPVIAGYAVAMTLLLGVSFALGRAAEAIPVSYLGYLGLVPLGMGISGLIAIFRPRQDVLPDSTSSIGKPVAVAIAAALAQLSNGTDTLLAFSALFADSNARADMLVAATFAGMVALFCASALYVLRQESLGRTLQRVSIYLTPLLLSCVGLYILADTVTDRAPQDMQATVESVTGESGK